MNKPDNDDRLVVFNSYVNDADAYIAKGVLETNGVPCIINNEIFSSVYPVGLAPWGSIKLLIFRRDMEKAIRIMKSKPLPGQPED
ncbi:MAG: DUF2007 domain-containing protein [Candidatus Homeothermus sp.]|nr:DUF2007 domain-containing protein [Candidatus Homeothermus sp.]